jgi:4-hydroxy-2-oxoheptanedioate aldolase
MGNFHDDLKAAIERIRSAALANGKKVGIYCVGGESARVYRDQGFHMVCMEVAVSCLVANVRAQISIVADVVALPTFLSNALKVAQD